MRKGFKIKTKVTQIHMPQPRLSSLVVVVNIMLTSNGSAGYYSQLPLQMKIPQVGKEHMVNKYTDSKLVNILRGNTKLQLLPTKETQQEFPRLIHFTQSSIAAYQTHWNVK